MLFYQIVATLLVCAELLIWFLFSISVTVAGFFFSKMEALVAGALKNQETWDVFAFKSHGFAPMGGSRFPCDKIMDAMSAVNFSSRQFGSFD